MKVFKLFQTNDRSASAK